jgi:hypothetical protein
MYEGMFKANGLNFMKFEIEKIEFTFTINDPNGIPLDGSDIGIKTQIFDSSKCYLYIILLNLSQIQNIPKENNFYFLK